MLCHTQTASAEAVVMEEKTFWEQQRGGLGWQQTPQPRHTRGATQVILAAAAARRAERLGHVAIDKKEHTRMTWHDGEREVLEFFYS